MTTSKDNVIAFPGVRVSAEPATLVLGAVLRGEPQTVHRIFGINDQLTLQECGRGLRIMFGWGAGTARVAMRFTIPASYSATGADYDIPATYLVGDVLQEPGDRLRWQWGLWQHELEVRAAFARDAATPDVLCIGGSGAVSTPATTRTARATRVTTFDVAAINQALTGEESIQSTLSTARADVVDVIERSGVFEFIPLLQALDLRREGDVVKQMRALPVESDPAARDAAIVTMLCCAALTGDTVRREVSEQVMAQLGWVADDGAALTAADIESLCAQTWEVLAQHGVVGETLAPAVVRLDLLREALRRR